MAQSLLEKQAKQAYELRVQLDAGDRSVLPKLEQLEADLDGRVYVIPTEYLPQIQNRIGRCAQAAMSAGFMPPMLREIERSFQTVITSSAGMRSSVETSMILVQAGELDAGEGWKLVASIFHNAYLRDGKTYNLVQTLGETSRNQVEDFESAPANCDHCGLRRKRNRTYIVSSPDGKLRQVGGDCFADYIGQSAENAARQAERILDLGKILHESEGKLHSWKIGSATYDPSGTGFFDAEQYLSWVAREIRLNGWVSRSEAWKGGSSAAASADQARSALLAALGGETLETSEVDQQLAEDTMRWINDHLATKSHPSDFEINLVRIADRGLVAYRELPRLAPAVVSYQKYLERIAATGSSCHVGTVGDRIELEVVVRRARSRETHFGQQQIYEMEDGDGNLLVWFSTSSSLLDEGESYKLRGTIKRHEIYRDAKRTVLTNCRVS